MHAIYNSELQKEHKPVKIIALKSMMIYLYGTIGRPIRVWTSHTSIRIWDVPYAYRTKYSYGAEHNSTKSHQDVLVNVELSLNLVIIIVPFLQLIIIIIVS